MRRLVPFLFVILGLGLGFIMFNDGAAGQLRLAPRAALGSGFTYQGQLTLDGAPAEGSYDFRFRLFDAADGGAQVGSAVTVGNVVVAGGRFSVLLDFGSGAFDGSARWLEIAVREGDSEGAYSTLSPRQALTATPYALHAVQAGSVDWSDIQAMPPGFADGQDGVDYANVIVVAQSGGDFSSVQAALDSIDDAGASNPYLVYVAPGVYEEQVTLKPYVTVQGAGEGATILQWTGGSQAPWDGGGSATLVGADNATVRRLSVESDGSGQSFAVGIYNNGASPTIDHVSAGARNADDTRAVANYNGAAARLSYVAALAADGGNNHAITNDASAPTIVDSTAWAGGGNFAYGIINWSGSSATMINVSATATGAGTSNFGLYSNSATPTMSNVTAKASGGDNAFAVYNRNGAAPEMSNVTATATDGETNYAVFNDNATPRMTDVIATATGGAGNRGVWNANASPEMTNVTIRVEGGTITYGVFNGASSPLMTDMTITAQDASSSNYGVFNDDASPALTDVVVSASGSGSTNVAINNQDSSPTLMNVSAAGTGGANNWGVWNAGSSPTIRHSVLEGASYSLYASGGAVQVANTQLIGPYSAGLTCFDNYDETLNAITCP